MRVFTGRFGRRVLVLAAALGVAAGAGFATAAITSSNATNTIVACQLNVIGTIRIVADPTKCNAKFETPISWNVVGPAGPQGLKGATGGIGPAGPQGLPGNASTVPGPQGLTGAAGAVGAVGAAGGQGPQGIPGTNGTDGQNGDTGLTGAQGVPGTPGTNGTNGKDGKDGSSLQAIEELGGLACTDTNGRQSTTQTGVDSSGTVTITCPAAPAPPPPPPAQVTLSGVGAFGTSRDTAQPRSHVFVLASGESTPETIAGADIAPGDFSITANSCGTQLAPGASCSITVTFDPAQGVGDYLDTLTVDGPNFTVSSTLTASVTSSNPCTRWLAGRKILPCP